MNKPESHLTASVPIVGANQNEVYVNPADIVLVNRGSSLSNKPFTQLVFSSGLTIQTLTNLWDEFAEENKGMLAHLKQLDGPK
jgi:hypothetical protein